MTQTEPQAEGKAKAPPAQMDENTYFVFVNDDYEAKASREYLKQLYPKSMAKVVAELRLDRLTNKHSVIALRRGNERTDAVRVIVNPQGVRTLEKTPIGELAKEIVEGEPVRCAKYWKVQPGGEGELDLAGFLSELGEQSVPAAIKHYPGTKTLKLGFG